MVARLVNRYRKKIDGQRFVRQELGRNQHHLTKILPVAWLTREPRNS